MLRSVEMLRGSVRVTLALCLCVWALSGRAGAQQSTPGQKADGNAVAKSLWPLENWEAHPGLKTRVWLVSPESTLQRVLTDLTARTSALIHLKLQAQSSIQQDPVSCYVAGIPLRDVMEGLATLGHHAWRQERSDTLELGLVGLVETTPHDETRFANDQNRFAYYGMRVVRAAQQQPGDLVSKLRHGQVALSGLPTPVCQAVQAWLKLNEIKSPGTFTLPVSPQSASLMLESTSQAGETRFTIRVLVAQQVPSRLLAEIQNAVQLGGPVIIMGKDRDGRMTKTIMPSQNVPNDAHDVVRLAMMKDFTAAEAAAYTPDPNADVTATEISGVAPNDNGLTQVVTLHLRAAKLTEALQSLFSLTHVPMLAEGSAHPGRADLLLTQLPLHAALDRLCAVYGYTWRQQASGMITLSVSQK